LKLNIKKLLLVLLFVIPVSTGYSLSPTGQFNSGRRAFMLGHWQEANETFSKFIKIWPDHSLSIKAIYFKTISEMRSAKADSLEINVRKLASLTQILNLVKEKLPNFDTSELNITIKGAKNSHWDIKALVTLPQAELMHVIDRNWHPKPSIHPLKTLEWISRWETLNNKEIRPDLDANIHYIKALALWQIVKSPLAKDANISIIKAWGSWPVHTALEEALDIGFSKGDPSLKREVALLGYHYEYFSHDIVTRAKKRVKKSRWYTYLNGRGLNHKEAWCPQ